MRLPCCEVPGAQSYSCSLATSDCVVDFGDDKVLSGGSVKVRNALYTMGDENGSFMGLGFLSAGGCTGDFPSRPAYHVTLTPSYYSAVSDISFSVRDCQSATTGCVLESTVLQVTPTGNTTTVELDSWFEWTAYTALAYTIDRLVDGYFGYPQEFQVRIIDQSTGAYVNLDAGVPTINLGRTRARSKYTLSHELGHAFVVEGIGTTNLSSLLDCSYGPGGVTSHTLLSPEWQSCAHYEGLSMYFEAAAYNVLGTNANGYIVDFGNVTDATSYGVLSVESGSKEIENQLNCSGSTCCGLAVELDWGRTLWDFRTDATTTKPHTMDPFSILINAYPYASQGADNCSPGHYSDIAFQYLSDMGLTFAQRFWNDAAYNGTDY
jgi:hypothetical protein